MPGTEQMTESLILVESLYNIAHESEDSEIVRIAFGALTKTEAGLNYIEAHPVTL